MEVPHIAVEDLAALDAPTVLDVRSPDEYAEAHVPGAVLVPLDELADRGDEVPAGSPLYVICRSGGRSLRACEHLRALGIDAVNVAGGTLAWIDAGYDTVPGDEPR